ncbi:MAG: cysteine hydrolase family protein [Acidimicrobiales bacterium]
MNPIMASDLTDIAHPDRTAVLTMEMQRGVVGDLATIEDLALEVARLNVVNNTARLVAAARKAGVKVVHCTAGFRPDLAGSSANSPLLASILRHPENLYLGSPQAELVPELGPEPSDLMSARLHGISPFIGTSLDAILRNMSVSCVVVSGVSLNLGVLGLCVEAVNLGYRVVVATDAVAGVPSSYAQAVMANTIALLASRFDVATIVRAWGG